MGLFTSVYAKDLELVSESQSSKGPPYTRAISCTASGNDIVLVHTPVSRLSPLLIIGAALMICLYRVVVSSDRYLF